MGPFVPMLAGVLGMAVIVVIVAYWVRRFTQVELNKMMRAAAAQGNATVQTGETSDEAPEDAPAAAPAVTALEAKLVQAHLGELRATAAQGDVRAQTRLANLYYLGAGVEQNTAEALNWYREAAAQGDAEAQKMVDKISGSGR